MKISIRLRKILSSISYPLYLKSAIFYQQLVRYFISFHLDKKKHIYSSLAELRRYKRSDTVFILGSGSSINNYNIEFLDHINKNDSIGFNFGMMMKLVPNYFVLEMGRDKNISEKLFNNINIVSNEYQNSCILVKDGDFQKHNLNDTNLVENISVKVLKVSSVPINKEKNFDYLSSYISNKYTKCTKKTNKVPTIYSKRATVFSLINFAHILGYKNIILCGVELDNNKYYYNDLRDELLSKGFLLPEIYPEKKIHKTNDPKISEITIEKLILFYDRYILKENGIKLYTATNESVLAKNLPVYWYKDKKL
jgi:hypothetical protein